MLAEMMTRMTVSHAALWLQTVQINPNGLTPDQQFELARRALNNRNGAVGIFVPIALFAMIVLIVWLRTRRNQATLAAQMDLRKQLLSKFGSPAELTTFLESPAGQQFLLDMRSPRAAMSRSWTWGLVMSMIGLALLILTLAGRAHALTVSVVLLAAGVGLLISTAIHHRLEKQSSQSLGSGPGNQSLLPS